MIKFMKTLGGLIGLSALAAASRSILSEDRRSIAGFMRGLVLAGFVGTVVGLLTNDMKFSPPTQGGIVGIAAFVADDILLFVINASRLLRDDPRIMIDWVLRRDSGGYRNRDKDGSGWK